MKPENNEESLFALALQITSRMKYQNQFSQSNARAVPHSIIRRDTGTRKRTRLTCSLAESSFSSCRCLLCHTR